MINLKRDIVFSFSYNNLFSLLTFLVFCLFTILNSQAAFGQSKALHASDSESVLPNAIEPLKISAQGAAMPDGYVPPYSQRGGPIHLWNAFAQQGISSSTFTQPKVVDLDGDGQKEIISSLLGVHQSIQQGVYVWNSSGNLRPNFPVLLSQLNTSFLYGYLSVVGVADVIGDSKKEIVVQTGRGLSTADPTGAAGIYIISSFGQVLSHFAPNTGIDGPNSTAVVLDDLDRDGKSEIILSNVYRRELSVYRGNGSLFPGFPITLSRDFFREPSVVKLPNGQKIIVTNITPYDFNNGFKKVRAFNTDGSLRWDINTIGVPFPRNVAGDVDGDGSVEIVFMSNAYANNQDNYKITILDASDGHVKYHWPITLGYAGFAGVSLGDLNNDKTLEIIYNDAKKVYVADFRGNLLPGYPRFIWDGVDPNQDNACGSIGVPPSYCYMTQLGVADLNGDGYADIFGTALYGFRGLHTGDYPYSVWAYDRFGQTLPGFPYHLRYDREVVDPTLESWGEQFLPTFADIDNNGTADMVVEGGWGRMEAITLNVPYNSKLAFFPQYGVNERNTKVIPSKLRLDSILSVDPCTTIDC